MITPTQTLKRKNGDFKMESQRNYKDIVSFLDSLKEIEYSEKAVERSEKLDKLFGNVSKKVNVISVAGVNGKSSTISFAAKILKEEGYKVGSFFSSHILNYNEQIAVNSENIANKKFIVALNKVVSVVEDNKIAATSFEVMLFAALIYFVEEKTDVALFEVGFGGKFDATSILNPKIVAITKIVLSNPDILGEDLNVSLKETLEIAKDNSWIVCAEQSKIILQKMKDWTDNKNVNWTMPVRKSALLPYVFEQLYGKTASLGERIAKIYTEDVDKKFSAFLRGNLLATKKGQRGRPTLEAKKNAEMNPVKTLKKFWGDNFCLMPGRFELLEKEQPAVLLDQANNIDALENVFLGVRLLHYQRSLKDLILIVGLHSYVKMMDAAKSIRYLLKKVSGQVIFVPLPGGIQSHNVNDLTNISKELGTKTKCCDSFEEAFNMAKKIIDNREGLIAVTGSKSLVTEYWNYRGIKK
jgi:dihydrofolate synthase / folylpolyglutamate synthase